MLDAALRRALFLLEPESSHDAALGLLAAAQRTPGGLAALRAMYTPRRQRPVELLGLRFPNPVGLAAGYDKNARAWRALGALGFGHVEVGTVTPRPQPGNPKPRIFRIPEAAAVINRLGFPSEGAEAVRARIGAVKPEGVILGVNLGRNKATPNERAAEDYAALVPIFAPVADYLVVNVSSPNTPGLRALQTRAALTSLLAAVCTARDAAAAQPPVLVKLAPDLDEAGLEDALAAAVDAGIDGVIATNTTLSREGLAPRWADEAGGLSGAPLTARATGVIERVRARLGDGFPLIGVGGIMSPDDAKARLDAGADLVQVYTGLIYGGAGWVRELVEAV